MRPTTDRVKESLFNIPSVSAGGKAFSGSVRGFGQIGLEALSRGAAQAVFVDASKESIRVVEKNLSSTGLGDRAKVVTADFAAYLRTCRDRFDVAFLDPPYRTGLLEQALPLVAEVMNPGGVILCEHPKEEVLPETAGGFARHKSYRYGKIMLTAYRPPRKSRVGKGPPGPKAGAAWKGEGYHETCRLSWQL